MEGEINNILNIVSYNCNSIRKRIEPVRDLLKHCDILLCQEIILTEDDSDLVRGIDDNFSTCVIPSTGADSFVHEGRPIGGMAIFYRSSLDLLVDIIARNDNFCLMKISNVYSSLFLMNIYMPYDDRTIRSVISYRTVLGEIQAILDTLSSPNLVLMGDFNADPKKGRFWSYLNDFIEGNGLKCDCVDMPDETFTYLSPSHNTTSWLDHVVYSRSVNVIGIDVLYNSALYDHFPISMNMNFRSLNNFKIPDRNIIERFVKWDNFDDVVKASYNSTIVANLGSLDICDGVNCIAEHGYHLDKCYEKIVGEFRRGTEEYLCISKNKYKPVPGWNEFCKFKHNEARIAFLEWVRDGKNRFGPLFDRMKETRKVFREALKYCKDNAQRIRDDKLTRDLQNRNSREFWKEVRSRNSNNEVDISEIDGLKNNQDIAQLFANKFRSITDASLVVDTFDGGETSANNTVNVTNITSNDVKNAIGNLNVGIGFDGIHSNHLKFLDNNVIRILTRFFNSCLAHSHIPKAMLEGVIRPCIKDRYGKHDKSDNYREIMISSNFLKVFDYCMLPRLQRYIDISSNQFGYRDNTSTVIATCLFKEVIGKYISNGSTVYSCFLDMSKAFERVNHDILLDKLRNSGVPEYIVNYYKCILSNSSAMVNINGVYSTHWKIGRGVRQGGVSSAYLFCLYIDDILREISHEPFGCQLGLSRLNVQAYADDIVLFCPSLTGLRCLTNKISNLLDLHGLVVNVGKTKLMMFNSKRKNVNKNVSLFMNNNVIETVFSYKYLGCIITTDLSNNLDMDRMKLSFNKCAGLFFRKFNSADLSVKMNIFSSLCLSFYGSELWSSRNKCIGDFKQLSIYYHAALKKILGIPRYFSNHYACEILNMMTFEHFVNFKILKFYFLLNKCNSPCFTQLKIYFMRMSNFREEVEEMAYLKYNLRDILGNDFDAIVSRIYFVQRNEPTSWFLGL